jgi:hypothetical protein
MIHLLVLLEREESVTYNGSEVHPNQTLTLLKVYMP